MSIFYSPSTGGFYLSDMHAGLIPADAKEITREQHQELMAGQSAGKSIYAGANGSPELIDAIPPPLTVEQIRARRDALLAASDWTQLPDSPLSKSKKSEWASYRQALRDMMKSVDVEWPVAPV